MRIAEYINGSIVYRDATSVEVEHMEREQAEMPVPEPTVEDKMRSLEERNDMLTECILELSELLYN